MPDRLIRERAARSNSAPRARRLALAALVACGLAAPAGAAPERYAIDTASSSVDFRIRYLGLFALGGHFGRVQGVLVLDAADWRTLEVTIEIPVDSLASRPEFWRSELLGPRFFDGARYPRIAFRAAHTERTGPGAVRTLGDLSLHGATRQVTLVARVAPRADALEVDGETQLDRSAFGLGTVLPFASDEVTVTLHIRAVRAAAR